MFQGEFADVLEAKTQAECFKAILAFARRLEFDTVSATLVVDRCGGEPRFIGIHNTPAAYLESYMDRDRGRADPVAQHCKSSNLPIVWDQATYVRANRPELWEHQAKFGYREGIAVAIHLPKGLHYMVAVDRDQAMGWPAAKLQSVLGELQLITVCAFEYSRLMLESCDRVPHAPALTPRELEVLRWAAEGKTAWETSRILSIAVDTVNRHVANASAKLECCGKRQAVVRAARLGLL